MDNSKMPMQAGEMLGNQASDVVVSGASHVANASVTQSSSMFGLFWSASPVIKLVMVGLLLASIWSWSVMINKHFRLKKLNAYADAFEDNFWSGMPLESLYRELKNAAFDPMSTVFCAAMAEWQRFTGKNPTHSSSDSKSLEMRVDRAMQIAIRKEIDELEKGMGFLSSLGTMGVIVGLFGTVVGIMAGVNAIATQQNVSMVTVAPIIAESLLTTAMGLVAAIPAALGYNKLMTDINRYVSRLETFADEFSSIISRQFDEH